MPKFHLVLLTAILSLSCLSTTEARAFGPLGHAAVCEIAYRELTPATRAKVDALMGVEPDRERLGSFREACNWPDFGGAPQDGRRAEHFANLPRGWVGISIEECHEVETCLFTAIRSDIAILSSKATSATDKLVALKFLGHWVGDIHQPMHVSYADDRGANLILVEGVEGCARGGETNLHAVWDICIPEEILMRSGVGQVVSNGDGHEAFGRYLRDRITEDQRARWKASLSPLIWANESLGLTRSAGVGYCILTGTVCRHSAEAETYTPSGRTPDTGRRVFRPGGDYEGLHAILVAQRLQQAGVRLAALLEATLP